jgi:hypothetical protein
MQEARGICAANFHFAMMADVEQSGLLAGVVVFGDGIAVVGRQEPAERFNEGGARLLRRLVQRGLLGHGIGSLSFTVHPLPLATSPSTCRWRR